MKTVSAFFIASLLAVILASVLFFRVTRYRQEFDVVVQEAQETTDGYDQAFIDMVNRLEEELATRASFGYIGEKDPMTGQTRSIVKQPKPVKRTYRKRKVVVTTPKIPVDPFRLSAIIYNDVQSKFTAIMMLGERSMAVEIGDVVEGRTVKSITKYNVEMSDMEARYRYDIEGKKTRIPLNEIKN